MKNNYVAITIAENGKYYSYVEKISAYDNLLSRLKITGIVNATLCNGKKHAEELTAFWNECFKKNGTNLF